MLAHRHLFARPSLRQNVWLDVSEFVTDAGALDAAVDRVMQQSRLRLAGMSCALDDRGVGGLCLETCIDGAIAAMEQIRRRHGVTLTQLAVVVADGTDPGAAIEDCLDEACARHRYPRPTATVLLHAASAGRHPVGPLDTVRDAALDLS